MFTSFTAFGFEKTFQTLKIILESRQSSLKSRMAWTSNIQQIQKYIWKTYSLHWDRFYHTGKPFISLHVKQFTLNCLFMKHTTVHKARVHLPATLFGTMFKSSSILSALFLQLCENNPLLVKTNSQTAILTHSGIQMWRR